MFLDNFCYTFLSPVVILPTVCHCALRKQLFQKLQVAFRQFWMSPAAGNPSTTRWTPLKFLIQFPLSPKNSSRVQASNKRYELLATPPKTF